MINELQESELRISELRPKLHRYCARLVGSAVDGEDIVQDSIVKALEALRHKGYIENLEGWLFRIAHNTSLDFLRRKVRETNRSSEEDVYSISDSEEDQAQRDVASASLQAFMLLPVAYRSTVILKDVLDYSVQEIYEITGMSIPSIKAALHRGRARLKEIGQQVKENRMPMLDPASRARLAEYVERFNAHDFDAVRALLAEDVQLEMVNKTRLNGKAEVATYFTNYTRLPDWHSELGWVDGQPAIVVRQPASTTSKPSYFILLRWDAARVVFIRDFVHARYVAESAEIIEKI